MFQPLCLCLSKTELPIVSMAGPTPEPPQGLRHPPLALCGLRPLAGRSGLAKRKAWAARSSARSRGKRGHFAPPRRARPGLYRNPQTRAAVVSTAPAKLTLQAWDAHHAKLIRAGLREPSYGGPLSRHVAEQDDFRLGQLRFDNSPAALRLWNFVLTENERLAGARAQGDCLVGAMKDLGTAPVIAYSFPRVRAFYPDGAWWTPCLMECSDGLLQQAERLGLDSSFCSVRAIVPAFLNQEHFPIPDLLLCSTGAVCDDFSAIAQRLEHLGHRLVWWEMPRRRLPEPGEDSVQLPSGAPAPRLQVDCARAELERIAAVLAGLAGTAL